MFVSGSPSSLFRLMLKHLATKLQCEEVYSSEFGSTTTHQSLSMSFWEGKKLITMKFAHCARNIPVVESNVLSSSQLSSAVSTDPRINCCGGSSLEFLKALYKTQSQKAGIQYQFGCLLCILRS